MTNKEAINIINNRLNTYYCTDEDLQALNLAVKALEETERNPTITSWYDFDEGYRTGYKKAKEELREV